MSLFRLIGDDFADLHFVRVVVTRFDSVITLLQLRVRYRILLNDVLRINIHQHLVQETLPVGLEIRLFVQTAVACLAACIGFRRFVIRALVQFQAARFLHHHGFHHHFVGNELAQFGTVFHLALALLLDKFSACIQFVAVDFRTVHGNYRLRHQLRRQQYAGQCGSHLGFLHKTSLYLV